MPVLCILCDTDILYTLCTDKFSIVIWMSHNNMKTLNSGGGGGGGSFC